MKRYFMAAAILVSSQISFAAEEPKFVPLLNLSSLTTGASVGNGLIVRAFDNGGNFLSAAEKSIGSLKVPINLSGKFEVSLNVFPGTFGDGIFIHLTASDDSKISIETQRAWVGFTGKYAGVLKQAKYNPEGWSDTKWNALHLLVDAGVAKLYINDIFLDKINLNNPNATFTNLIIPTITEKDAITDIGVKQLSGTTTGNTSTSGNASLFELSKTYEQQGLYAKALETIEQALATEPNNDTYLAYAAHYARYAGKDEIGLQYGIKAISLNKQVAWYHVTTALSAYNLNQKDTAKHYADSALAFGKDALGQANYDAIMSILSKLTTVENNGCSSPVTLGANLNMKLPNISYQPSLGNPMNLWAELQFMPTNDGKFWWTLSNYGVNN